MAYDEGLSIKGLQEAQADNQRRIAMLQPRGEVEAAIKDATIGAQRYAISITHIDSGSLKASHRMKVDGKKGTIYIDPRAVNPRSGQKPAVYGFYENKRGGAHAFYDRTVEEYGGEVVETVDKRIRLKL